MTIIPSLESGARNLVKDKRTTIKQIMNGGDANERDDRESQKLKYDYETNNDEKEEEHEENAVGEGGHHSSTATVTSSSTSQKQFPLRKWSLSPRSSSASRPAPCPMVQSPRRPMKVWRSP